MLKKRWQLLALLAVVAAAACVWALRVPTATETVEAPAATAQPYTMIYESSLPQWTRMELNGRDFDAFAVRSDMVYDADGQLLGVRNALAQPVLLEGDEGFRFSTYGYQMILLVAQHLPSVETLGEAVGGEAAYGLDQPTVVCRSEYADGSERTVRVGALTPSGDRCYVAVDGRVYLVPADLYQTLAKGLPGLHFLPASFGFAAGQVTALQIERAGEATIQIEQKDDGALLPYCMTAPLAHDANKERLLQALAHVCAAAPDGYVANAATDEALAAYGLASPRMRLTFVVEGQYMAQIAIGDDTEGGAAYMTLDRSGDVYRVSKDKLAFMDELTCDRLLERYVSLVSLTELNELRVASAKAERVLSLSWDEGATQPTAYYIDGTEVERAAFSALYQRTIAPMLDKTSVGLTVSGEARLTLTFALRDGTSRQVRYLPYDAFYNAVEIDGQTCFLIREPKVDALLAAFFGEP